MQHLLWLGKTRASFRIRARRRGHLLHVRQRRVRCWTAADKRVQYDIVHGVLDCSVYRGVYGHLYWTCASLPAAVQSHPIRPTTSPIMQLTDVMTRSHFAKWSLLRPRRSPANSDLVGWEITILLCGLLSDICARSVPFRSMISGIRQV